MVTEWLTKSHIQNVSELCKAARANRASAAVQHLACNLRGNNYPFPIQSAQNFTSGEREQKITQNNLSALKVGGAKTIRYSSLVLFKHKGSFEVLYSIHSPPT